MTASGWLRGASQRVKWLRFVGWVVVNGLVGRGGVGVVAWGGGIGANYMGAVGEREVELVVGWRLRCLRWAGIDSASLGMRIEV